MTTETKFTVGEYTMRNGREAKVVAQYGEWLFGVVNEGGVAEFPSVWNLDGTSPEDDNRLDLMPPLREWWVVRHPQTGVTYDVRSSRDQAISAMNVIAPNSNCEIIHVREVRDDQA